jgi:hypothetical protein
MLRLTKRALLRCLTQVAIVLLSPLVLLGNAAADVRFVGGDSELRGRLTELVSTRWPGDELAAIDLTITIGATALDDYCSAGESLGPVLAIHLYASHYRQSTAHCRVPIAAIPADAPLSTQIQLSQALFPRSRTAMLVRSDATPLREQAVDIPLAIPSVGVAKGLGRLVKEGRWDVFLLPVDHEVFSGADYRLVIETLFRHRKPTIVSINSLLSVGAIAATFYSQSQLDHALLLTLERYLSDGVLEAATPERVTVTVNRTVLRNLYGRTITAEELRALENEVNGG